MPGHRGTDDHVRALLDQRAQRADVPPHPTRFSIFSDRSDSPSLYSHFDSTYRNAPSTPVPRFPRINDNDHYNDRHDIYPPLSPKERLADPNASSLDLSEDTDAYSESGTHHADPEDDSNLVAEEGEDPETRLSLMGPKMRVHSRAPWEEDDGSLSDGDSDDGGNDNTSIFGGKKSGLMRNLGFRSRSPAPRPSFDSGMPTKGKYSFDTTSCTAASVTSRSALQTLAQASISSTSLAIGPTPATNRLPHKLSMGRLALSRDCSTSGPTSASDTGSNYPPLSSPRSAVYTDRPSGRDSPASHTRRRDSISPNRTDFTSSIIRTRSPSPIPLPDKDSSYTHPYANPALLSAYRHRPGRNNFIKDDLETGSVRSHVTRNDSMATLAASEETVTLAHSSSTVSASVTSTSGMEISTPPTSDFSLVSSASRTEVFKVEDGLHELEKLKQQQKRSRRETKLGPISAPSLIANNGFGSGTPHNLISLEQAQARIRERNRSATTSAVPFPANSMDENGQNDFTPRARSTSATGKDKHPLPFLTIDNRSGLDDISSPLSPTGSKQLSPAGPPGGKVIRPKRSGFMKLFNGREKDKVPEVPPPLPLTGAHGLSHADQANPPPTARPPKVMTHRVPVPTIPPSPIVGGNKDESRLKKTGPQLSIKVSSPPMSRVPEQGMSARRSDSPKSLHPPVFPKMPSSAPADMTQFPALRLRPVSAFFSKNFAEHLLTEEQRPESPRNGEVSSLISPTTVASSDLIPSPVNAGFNIGCGADYVASGENEGQEAMIAALKDQIRASRITWQRQIWELEGQIRDLRAEIDDLKSGDVCEACGRGGSQSQEKKVSSAGVIHRPRAKTGHGARFASGNDS